MHVVGWCGVAKTPLHYRKTQAVWLHYLADDMNILFESSTPVENVPSASRKGRELESYLEWLIVRSFSNNVTSASPFVGKLNRLRERGGTNLLLSCAGTVL
jgi:hypothetical protein